MSDAVSVCYSGNKKVFPGLLLSVLSLFCLTSSQIAASGTVVATLTGIPTNVALVIAGLVVILYTTFGGMIADQISDLVQFIIILVGLAIATPFVIEGCGGWEAISSALPPVQLDFAKIGWVTIIGYIFNYFCTFLAGPEMVSRFETAKDERTAQNASWLSAILMAAMSIFPTLLGLAALAVQDTIPGLAADGSNAMMAVTSAHAPGVIVGLVSAAIICATMSSADSNLLCMSTMVMNDLYMGLGGKRNLSEKSIIFYTRACNVVFALIAGLWLHWRIEKARRRMMEERFDEQFRGGTPFGSADPFGGAARGGDAFGGRRARNPREGEVKIYVTSEAPEKRVAHGVGDYVDFEETKTDDKKR